MQNITQFLIALSRVLEFSFYCNIKVGRQWMIRCSVKV